MLSPQASVRRRRAAVGAMRRSSQNQPIQLDDKTIWVYAMRSSTVSSRSTLAALLFLSAITVVLVVHRLHIVPPTGSSFLASSDVYQYFLPNGSFLHEELRSGNLPLWNPFQFAGQPFLGLHVPAVLYPLNLMAFTIFDAAQGLEALFVAHMVIVGFFTWLFARRVGLGDLAAVAAATTYALSSPVVLGLYQPAIMSGNAWLPAILWAIHGLTSERRLRWAWALGTFLALAFLSGHAQGFVYQVQFAACYGVFAWLTLCPPEHRRRCVGVAAAAGGLAFALAAPQLLPALELAKESVRGVGGISFEETIFVNHIPLFAGPYMLLEGLLGAPGSYLRGAWPEFSVPAVTIPLVAAGLLSRRHRGHWLMFSLSILVVAMLVMGPRTPLYRIYYELPFGDLFRQPTRMNFLYTFLASVLLGIGMDSVRERLRSAGVAPSRILVAGTLLVAVAAGDAYARANLPWIHPAASNSDDGPAAELVEALRTLGQTGRVFLEPGVRGDGKEFLNEKLGTMVRLPIVPDYEPNPPGRYARYFEVPSSPPWHGGLRLSRGLHGSPEVAAIPLLDLMSVRHYAIPVSSRRVITLLETLSSTRGRVVEDMILFERSQALPRTYLVHRLMLVPDEESALQLLRKRMQRLRTEAIVIEPSSKTGARRDLGRGRSSEAEFANLVAYGVEEATIDARCESVCMLVFTDLDYPGWKAYAAESEIPIRRVNVLFRGVELPAGDHRVVFRYEPRSFHIGLAIAAAGIAAAGVLTIRSRTRLR